MTDRKEFTRKVLQGQLDHLNECGCSQMKQDFVQEVGRLCQEQPDLVCVELMDCIKKLASSDKTDSDVRKAARNVLKMMGPE